MQKGTIVNILFLALLLGSCKHRPYECDNVGDCGAMIMDLMILASKAQRWKKTMLLDRPSLSTADFREFSFKSIIPDSEDDEHKTDNGYFSILAANKDGLILWGRHKSDSVLTGLIVVVSGIEPKQIEMHFCEGYALYPTRPESDCRVFFAAGNG